MNEVATERTMTIKEISEILNVSRSQIEKTVREIFPNKMINGKTTYLNETEVTKIKLKIQSKPYLGNISEVTTETEMSEMTLKVIKYHVEKSKRLESEIAELKPKALQHDLFMANDSAQRIGDVAKTLNIKPNTLHRMLRDAKILKENHVPYADYDHLFKTVETPTAGGFNVFTAYIKPEGISYIVKRFNLK